MGSSTTPTLLDRVIDYINVLDIERRNRLAAFCGVQAQTIRRWHRGESVPFGKRALQLHYLLDYVGYGNHQWRESNEAIETVGRAVAFGVVTDKDLIAAFGSECDEITRIIQMLTGHKHVSPNSQTIFEMLASQCTWDINKAQDKWSDLKVTSEKDKLLAELAAKLHSILPLVKDLASDKWSESDRYELRERAGPTTVFQLYNLLGELCGERARAASVAERAKKEAAALACYVTAPKR